MKEYFSHDYNARNDKQLVKLHMKHGLSGIGAYWCIIEMLNEEGGYLNIDEYERITFELRTEHILIKSVIEDFDLFVNDGVRFWSETGLKRLQERMAKSEKARKSVQSRWDKIKKDTNVLQTNNDSNTIKVKERKVNKSKEDNIEPKKEPKFNFRKSVLGLGVKEEILNDWLIVREKKKASNTETAFKAIKKQIELKVGKTANDCIEQCVERSWSGFNSTWEWNSGINNQTSTVIRHEPKR